MQEIIITIATVSYNAASTIDATINSVLSQTYPHIEYVIVDGNSNDGTIAVLKKYDGKIRWISEPDNGIYDAMNKALTIATGDFILFLGADDTLFSTTTIEEMVPYLTDRNHIYYGRVMRVPSNEQYGSQIKNSLDLVRNNICHQSIFYPKNVYKKYKYNLLYKIYADQVYNWFLYSLNKRNFTFVDLFITRFYEEGVSGSRNDVKFRQDEYGLMADYFGLYMPIVVYCGRAVKKIIRKFWQNCN